MMQTILSKTIYQKRLMIFWWFLGLMSMVALTMVFFPAFKNGGLAQSLNSLPKGLQNIIGNAASFQTVGGYIAQEIFSLRLPLLTIVLAVAIFNSLSVGEEKRGILETQLSLPISRVKLLAQKLGAGTAIVLLASIGTFLGVLLGLLFIHEHYSVIKVLQETLGCALLSIDFGLVTFMLGSASGNKGMTLGTSSGIAFASYLVSSMAPSVSKLQGIEKFSLFHYYHPLQFNVHQALVLVGVAVLLIAAGFIFFVRRDIKT